jgi:hypothetical protein
MSDELRSAYAALGLQPGAPLTKVKRQFKTLVRRWHPDRFASDPQGAAEANDRLRVINNAYSTILARFEHASARFQRTQTAPWNPESTATPEERPVSAPLTREQIDLLIAALTAHRRRRPLRDQMWDDPWHRIGSAVVVGVYSVARIWIAWRYPWPRFANSGVRPASPATAPVIAAFIETLLWTLPLLWVIWYGNTLSKAAAWLFLLLLALVLPLILVAMRL